MAHLYIGQVYAIVNYVNYVLGMKLGFTPMLKKLVIAAMFNI